MALLNLFGKKRKESTKRPVKAPKVSAVAESQTVAEASPVVAAPASPVLKSFHVSEKSTRGFALNQYTFVVESSATKTQVRDAVKKSYKVDVVSVNMVRLPAKQRTVGRYRGSSSAKKKAVVTLKEGQTIAAAQS